MNARRALVLAALFLLSLSWMSAQAGVFIGVGVPGPYYRPYPYRYYGPRVYVAPPPVYVQPAPVYVQPAPVYAQPAPAYSQPAPAYAQPAPAYVQPPSQVERIAPTQVATPQGPAPQPYPGN